jgi:hypothetical protein
MKLNPWRRQEPLDHAELARLLPAPGDPVLPPDRQLLLEEHLMREMRQQHTAMAGSADPADPADPADLAGSTDSAGSTGPAGPATSAGPTGSTPPRRSRRRLTYIAIPGVLLVLGGGALAGTTLLGSSPASPPYNSVRCYSAAELSSQYTTTTTLAPVPGGAKPIAAKVSSTISACAGLWAAGLIQPGQIVRPTARPDESIVIPDDATPGQGNVPLLTACVLDGGEAAVFAGSGPRFCQNLGLPDLADQS